MGDFLQCLTQLLLLISFLAATTKAFQKKLERRRLISFKSIFNSINNIANADELNGWDTNAGSKFLKTYWQKKPVLIRNAISNISYDVEFISQEDMYELSYDEDVESRILIKDINGQYNKEYGPFDSKYTRKLPDKDWTILIQEVDRHIPRVADIWQKYFNFIPSWRRDDIMVSFAAPGGGIGAHVDSYDVFLIQGRGQRQWSIENNYISAQEELIREVPDCATRLIRDFRADQTWILNAGDMLYLPPRIPHQGLSLGGGCTTVSMGFRSPSHRSMITALCDYICQNTIPESLMYSDPDLAVQESNSYIGDYARSLINKDLTSHILNILQDKDIFDYWLGRYLTIPLRMQLRKPKPFFMKDSNYRSLKSCLEEKGLRSRLNSPSKIDSSKNSDINGNNENSYNTLEDNIVSILSGQSYENDEDEYEDDDSDNQPPISIRGKHRVASNAIYNNINEIFHDIDIGKISLRRAEGVKFAYIDTAIFVDGIAYELPGNGSDTSEFGRLLCDQRVITLKLINDCGINLNSSIEFYSAEKAFFSGFIESGNFYPIDIV